MLVCCGRRRTGRVGDSGAYLEAPVAFQRPADSRTNGSVGVGHQDLRLRFTLWFRHRLSPAQSAARIAGRFKRPVRRRRTAAISTSLLGQTFDPLTPTVRLDGSRSPARAARFYRPSGGTGAQAAGRSSTLARGRRAVLAAHSKLTGRRTRAVL